MSNGPVGRESNLMPYEKHQRDHLPVVEAPEPSGVACSEPRCNGEMMIQKPYEKHFLKGREGEKGAIGSGLKRAICSECGWRGWV